MSEIASPTLALLYLAQGHDARARATLDEVLAEDRHNGHALALLERLDRPRPSTVQARYLASESAGTGELELRWSTPPQHLVESSGLAIVLALTRLRSNAGLRFTSRRCPDLGGALRVPAPLGPASAAVALVASSVDGLAILAVAEPLSW